MKIAFEKYMYSNAKYIFAVFLLYHKEKIEFIYPSLLGNLRNCLGI
jgi:hypothetical protein